MARGFVGFFVQSVWSFVVSTLIVGGGGGGESETQSSADGAGGEQTIELNQAGQADEPVGQAEEPVGQAKEPVGQAEEPDADPMATFLAHARAHD
jgi:hypothetical protein